MLVVANEENSQANVVYYWHKDTSNSALQILRGSGVVTAKITHHRTAALQFGGFNGLAPWQINSLTKHMLEKQNKAYSAVCEQKVSCKHSNVPCLATY